MNKKILLLAIGLLLSFTAFAKDCPPSLNNKGAEFAQENNLTCLYKEYYENGKLKWIVNYKNGKREGKWKFYYENGKLEGIGNYKNGKLEGESKVYYENGKLKAIENWKNGKEEGEYKLYDENGKVKEIEIWNNGKLLKTKKNP